MRFTAQHVAESPRVLRQTFEARLYLQEPLAIRCGTLICCFGAIHGGKRSLTRRIELLLGGFQLLESELHDLFVTRLQLSNALVRCPQRRCRIPHPIESIIPVHANRRAGKVVSRCATVTWDRQS
jgi:hypothetical protein